MECGHVIELVSHKPECNIRQGAGALWELNMEDPFCKPPSQHAPRPQMNQWGTYKIVGSADTQSHIYIKTLTKTC